MNPVRISQKLISAAFAGRLAGQGRPGSPAAPRRGRVYSLAVVAALLAAFGGPGLSRAVAPAGSSPAGSSPALTWTKQHPATSPPARDGASMAYDAATRTVVLFGGQSSRYRFLGGTWAWNGGTWTKRARRTNATPAARDGAAMAYDAATRTVVLFGGVGTRGAFGDTWTWDGSTWTKRHPAASPPDDDPAAMAYDAATGTVVLYNSADETWTWNGADWTEQASGATGPPGEGESMAYDAATRTVVLFGGDSKSDTWTWNGADWTRQAPATSPPARWVATMAFDAATGTVVLFGGRNIITRTQFNDTWTWNGADWTKQAPATSPPARDVATMAYDAATGTVVLFGGANPNRNLLFRDTWAWGSS